MALFKILRGSAKDLPKELKDGYAYFCTDTHDFYIDYTKEDGTPVRAQLNAKEADSLQNQQTIELDTAVKGLPRVFDGTKNISIPVTEVKEAYLTWGGKNLAGAFSPLDASLIQSLGANRFAFANPGGIVVEASKDNGNTWVPYIKTDEEKTALFSDITHSYFIGGDNSTYTDKSAWQFRVTITQCDDSSKSIGVYTALNKYAISCSISDSRGCWCTIEGRKREDYLNNSETWESFVDKAKLDGWSGWNIINCKSHTIGTTSNAFYAQVRFTFGVTTHSASSQYAGLAIHRIMAFGGEGWKAPSNMAKHGHLYAWDALQNAIFPAKLHSRGLVYAEKGLKVDGSTELQGAVTATSTVAAPNFKGTLIGNADTATEAGAIEWNYF